MSKEPRCHLEPGAIIDEAELVQLMAMNNPDGEPVGRYTGHCSRCGSRDLWDEVTAYGCRNCGGFYITRDFPPDES